jgi:hypothetical protein
MKKVMKTNQPKQNVNSTPGENTNGFPGASSNRQGPRQNASSHEGSTSMSLGLKGGTSHGSKGTQSSNSHPSIPVGGHFSSVASHKE